jgi:hypothetical protein
MGLVIKWCVSFTISFVVSYLFSSMAVLQVTKNDYDTTDLHMVGDGMACREDALDALPRIDSANRETSLMFRHSTEYADGYRHGVHILFNFAATMLRRSGRPLKPNMMVQHFVQSLASTVFGVAFPILFLQAMLFPKHFWCSPARDLTSVFGCNPISCYRSVPWYLDGFASPLERARNLCTHSSCSTATDDRFTAHLWDQQANLACNGYDSRVIQAAGFAVDKNLHLD